VTLLARVPILVAVVLQSIWALKVFDLVFVLTKGGPADATLVLNFLAWRVTFAYLDLGLCSHRERALRAHVVLGPTYVRALIRSASGEGRPRRERTMHPGGAQP
jgi:ABC-type sugar transport system permease subunit